MYYKFGQDHLSIGIQSSFETKEKKMVRIQRLDYENQKFPVVLMFLFVLTSLGTLSFIFLGHRPITIPESKIIPRFHNGAIGSEELQTVISEQPLISPDFTFLLYSNICSVFLSC